ncbi:hypothetical protein H180DRAFT_02373 [Streptomyces sp. WMMB 322]|nr:hypothetical protein H180DRAFT_02373 [Streptomyces sp. WMMB 322]
MTVCMSVLQCVARCGGLLATLLGMAGARNPLGAR